MALGVPDRSELDRLCLSGRDVKLRHLLDEIDAMHMACEFLGMYVWAIGEEWRLVPASRLMCTEVDLCIKPVHVPVVGPFAHLSKKQIAF